MLTIAVIVFLCCLALCLHSAYRLHRKPSKRLRIWLACSGAAVLVFGAALSIVFAQVNLIKHQERFLKAALNSYTTARHQVASYDADGKTLSIPCSTGVAATHDFNAHFAVAPTWGKAPVYDHATVAMLSYTLYKMLQVKGCVSTAQVESTLAHLRAMQSNDESTPPLWGRFLMRAPLGLVPTAPSMRTLSAITWAALSPHTIAVQNCYEALMRSQPNAMTPSNIATCQASTPPAIHS